jgi:hypoxanthine-DNA glycosylase
MGRKSKRSFMPKENHPFEPIINQNSKILILGTFPSLDSFKYHFYYAHKRNQFWKILSEIFDVPLSDDKEKVDFLLKNYIALWDMVQSCERKNSADSNLKNIMPHDIPALLSQYPNIQKILFTGKKAEQIYMRYFKDLEINTAVLPSPSPAYAAMSYFEKLKQYTNHIFSSLG